MKIRIQLVLFLIMLAPVILLAQLSDVKLTSQQLKEVYKLADKTKHFSIENEDIEKIRKDYESLTEYTLPTIIEIVETLEPKSLESIDGIDNQKVKAFVNDFYNLREESLSEMYEKNHISNKSVATSNFKQLLTNEISIILNKESIVIDGQTVTKAEIKNLLNTENNFDVFLKILNQNIDDKAWDKKSNFVLNNANMNLFR